MFTEDELREFDKDFCKIGLTDEAERKKILEFLYTYGTIAYNIISTSKTRKNGKEESK